MKRILLLLLFVFCNMSYGQLIVDNTTQTPAQLVQNVLLGSGITVSNITFNGTAADANTIRDQVGHFTNGVTTNIGIDSGVILSTGRATAAIGPNNSGSTTLTTTAPMGGDPDLAAIATGSINTKAILEFDFVPVGQSLSFNFVFGSEEYLEWVGSSFNDVFGFFLSGPGITGPYSNGAINIALVPSSTTPISINNVNATSNNAYYVNNGTGATPAINQTIQYDGFTTVIAALGNVQCGQTYHIKLAISNVGDSAFDSAVFLQAQSFNTTPLNLGLDLLTGNGLAPCSNGLTGGAPTVVDTGLGVTVPHVWTLDGVVIPGETGPVITITSPGLYCVTAYPYGPSCPVSDCLVIEFLPPLPLNPPNNLIRCINPFDLTQNTPVVLNGLNPANYDVNYFATLANAEDFFSPIGNPANYVGTDGQTIYIRVDDSSGAGCFEIQSFTLTIAPIPTAPNPADVTSCDSYTLPALAANETYHSASGGLPATEISAGTVITTSQTIYIYAQSAPGCGSEGDFVVTIITGTPPNPSDVTVCGSYTLPALPSGSTYHSASGGASGTLIPVGTVLTTSQVVYVFSQSATTPSCSAEGDFVLTVNTAPATPNPADVTACDSYVLPALPAGQTYHTVSGGSPATQIPAGTVITTSQTIIIFAQSGTVPNCTAEGDFVVTINVTPATPNPADVTVCDSYILPALPAGSSYHTLPNGGGTTLLAGASITTTQVIYVFAQTGTTPNCTAEGDFVVTVNYTPVPDNPNDVTSCGSYTLPALTVGNYFTGTNASGTPLFAGDVITTNQTIYIYAQTGTVPNCSSENSFDVTIIIAPTINTPTDYVVCDDSYNNDGIYNTFDLTTKDNEISTDPNLTIEYYETLTGAQTGSIAPLTSPYQNNTPGLQPIYVGVFNPAAPLCRTVTQFNLIVNPLPLANPVITDYELCETTIPGDGVEIFTLNTKDVEIANGQTGVTINYYGNLADATANNTAAALSNLYPNATPNQQQIWINISNNVTGCSSVGTFNLVVNPLPTVVAPDPMFECSNGATMTAEFDLTLNNGTISGGNPGVTVTYYLNLADAQNEQNPLALPYTNIANPQTVYVRVENNATGCYDTTTLELNVTQGPVANTPTPLEYCDPNNDGYGFFDLTDAIADIVGGALPPGVSVSFHETATDAQIGATPITDTTAYPNIDPWTQTIYVRVFYTLTNCANFVELQLIVNPTPEATEPQPYHECDNDYDGFTIFDLSTINAEALGSIDPTTHTVLYYTTLPAAQVGDPANAISNVTYYSSNNQTIYIRVENNTTGCFDIVTLQLVVDPLPTSSQPSYLPYSLCETPAFGLGFESFNLLGQVPTILNGQTGVAVTFYPTLLDAQNGTNVIPTPSYVNADIYVQTLGIRLTNEATGCFVVSTMDIRVDPVPTPISPITPPTVCDTDQNGYAEFDLDSYTAEILQGANYIITYHETETNALLGIEALTSPYPNLDPFVQVIYVAATDPISGCRQVMPLTLNVNPSPIMPSLNDLTLCDQTNNSQDGITVFDLTVQTPLILAAQTSPASDYTVTYYISLADAEDQINNIVNVQSYTNTVNGQTIWAVVQHNTTDCFMIGTFQLNVNAPLLLTTPAPLSICDTDSIPNDQFTTFDLTIRNTMITGGLPGYTVTYYPSWPITSSSVAIADPTAYINASPAVQTLGVLVTSPQGCTSVTTLTIRVLPIPTPNTNPPALAPQCDYNNTGDMVEIFDLTVNAAYIMNNDPNVTLTYFYTQADAMVPTNAIPDPMNATVGQNVWIRVENQMVDYTGNNCYVLVEQPLTVNPLPSLATIPDYQICEEDAVTNDGFEVFDLTTQAAALLANNPVTTPATTYTMSYYTDAALTNQITTPTAYTNISNPQTIYVVATNDTTGCRSQVGSFNILVNPKPDIAAPTTLLNTCDSDGTNDGYFAYPLDGAVTTEVLNGQDPLQFAVTFYDSEYNPDATPPLLPTPIADQAGYMGYTHTIWAVVTNIATGCQKIVSFGAIVEQLPEPQITTVDDINTICVDFTDNVVVRTLTLTAINNTVYLDPTTVPAFEYHWFEDGAEVAVTTTPSYTITQPLNDGVSSNFTVQMINQTALMCEQTSAPFEVLQSGQAEILNGTIGYTVTNAFADNQIITVTVQGFGTYEYSLDDGPRQVSNVFENVSLGTHTITVWDTEGGLNNSCDELVITDVQTIDYPHYFTPNGDGIHDNWNIVGLDGQPSSKIYIFDRFGKLIKQISSTSDGWDGTFNGQPLPSTDYWFTVDFMEQGKSRQFKAHFSLKR